MKETKWWKSGSYSLLGMAAHLGFAFVAFIILVRVMPEYEFGVWVLFMVLVSFAEMGRLGLLQNAIVKYCVEEEGAYETVLTTGLVMNTVGVLIISLILWLLSFPLSQLWSAPELVGLVAWYAPWALIYGTARYFDFPHMVHHDFKGVFWSKFVYGAAFLMIIGGVFYWKNDIPLHYLPIMQAFAGIPSLLVFWFYGRAYLRWGKFSKIWALKIFHFGKFVLGTNISSMLFNKMDLMMVGAFINPAAVAIYNVATRVTNYMEVPMSGISQVIYPRLALANSDGGVKSVSAIYEKAVSLILALIFPLAVVVLGLSEHIVVLIAGKQEYAAAAPILNILVLAVMIKPWGRLFGITLDAIGKPSLNFLMLIAGLFVNIALNATLIPIWGLKGAAFATLFSMITMIVAGQVLIMRILPVSQRNIFKQIWSFYMKPMQVFNL